MMRLDTQITLQKPTTTDLGGGVTETTPEDVATVWAQLKPVGSSEYWRAQQVGSSVQYEATIRAPVTDAGGSEVVPESGWSVAYGGSSFDVVAPPVRQGGPRGAYWIIKLSKASEVQA